MMLLSAISHKVHVIRLRINNHSYARVPVDRFIFGDSGIYAQNYSIGEEPTDHGDIITDDEFAIWSDGLLVTNSRERINEEQPFFYFSEEEDRLTYVVVPLEIPDEASESKLPVEYGQRFDDIRLKSSGIKFENVSDTGKSLSELTSKEVSGASSELWIAADVLKRRLAGKDVDPMLKLAILNARSPKKNLQAIRFALSSNGRGYTHIAWHILYTLQDLYRQIERQSEH